MRKILFSLFTAIIIFGCSAEKSHEIKNNALSLEEKQNGWELLFDGHSIDKWRDFKGNGIRTAWIVEDGNIFSLGKGAELNGDIVTKEKFSNFDLKLEWKIEKGGNSGIFYGIVEDGFEATFHTGPEYQLIDDVNFPEKLEEWQQCGADYSMYNADKNKKLNEVGMWNSSEIIVKDSLVQYFLNGEKIVEFKRWTNDWNQRVQNGKWKDYPSYGLAKEGHIGLQDHGSVISFRNIKIKRL